MLIRAFLFAECCAFRKTAYNSQIGSTSGASCCLRGRVRMPHPLQVDGNFRTPRGSRFTLFAHSKLRDSHGSHAQSFQVARFAYTVRSSHTRCAVRTLALTVAAQKFTCWRSLLTRGSHTRFTADAFFTQMLYTDYRLKRYAQ